MEIFNAENVKGLHTKRKAKLKVCGITSLNDAHVAVNCGAEYLGFNFYSKSPRYIPPLSVRQILQSLPSEIIPVGIFVNESSPAIVTQIMRESGVLVAQLHGDEDLDYCREVGMHRVIKVFRVTSEFVPESVLKYDTHAVLLDAYDKNHYGGTGKTVNWEVAGRAAKLTRVFLAGGLSPDNICQAIDTVRPFAVDVNSGVEIVPGVKDAGKLRQLAMNLNA